MGNNEEPKLETIPPDPRHYNQNVTQWCFSSFVDYHKCIRLLGKKNPGCEQFAKIYKAICPNSWISRWEEQIDVGTFPVDLPPSDPPCKSKKK